MKPLAFEINGLTFEVIRNMHQLAPFYWHRKYIGINVESDVDDFVETTKETIMQYLQDMIHFNYSTWTLK